MLEGVASRKPFYIAPYLSGGIQQDNQLNGDETGYERNDDPKLSAGLDVKYGLTNNLTMDVTINTDFAQVEADNEQINLTRFSLFFTEKRTFFQERSSIFSYSLGGRNDMFYSRTIGMYKGDQVPIYAGARITGMAGKWDIGFMDMQTRAYESGDTLVPDLSSENFGIIRLRRNVINQNSYLGGIVTSRIGTDGTYNVAYGIDGIFRLFGNDYLNLRLSQVMDDANENKVLSLKPTNIFVNWNRYNEQGLCYNFTYTRNGADYNPGMGFMMRSDFTFYSAIIQHGWIMGESSPLFSQQIGVTGEVYTDNDPGRVESSQLGISYDLQTKGMFFTSISISRLYENVLGEFSLSDEAIIPIGKYTYYKAEVRIYTPRSRRLSARIEVNGGQYYDGARISFTPILYWNASATFNFELNYSYNKVRFTGRDQDFLGQIFGLNAQVMFSTKLTLSAFIQYNSTQERTTTNLRLRYNPREGNDFYIVFNEGRNTDIHSAEPELPKVSNRLILLKYTYTFVLK